MGFLSYRWAKCLLVLSIGVLLSSCGLPRSGPTKGELLDAAQRGDTHIVNVSQSVAYATMIDPGLGFDPMFLNAAVVGADTIQPGDTLGLTLWENVNDGILTTAGAPASLDQVQVDSAGMIFVPYAGPGQTHEACESLCPV